MQLLVAKQAVLAEQDLNDRLKEIAVAIRRLEEERARIDARLRRSKTAKPNTAKQPGSTVECQKCGRDRDFLTDMGGYLGHVLEDPSDTEGLEAGKPLFCTACGNVFLFEASVRA